MSRKAELEKISEAYKEVISELNLGPGAETTNTVPSNNTATVVKLSDKPCGCEDCEDCKEKELPSTGSGESDADMAKNELYKLHNASKSLYNILKDNQDLEPWVFSKITLAASYIDSVKNYLEYNKFKTQGEFDADAHNHEYKMVSKIRDMLYGESKEVLESVLRQAIFNLEALEESKKIK
jgi:hypothetical protein